MRREFVTSDTHGCYDQLKNCLDQANFDYQQDRLIHCGDVVDRGPDSKKVVALLLQIEDLIALKGNHDDWWKTFLDTGQHPANFTHGGNKTLDSYLDEMSEPDDKGNYFKVDVPLTHRSFFDRQLVHYTDEQNRFFCHAGYYRDEKIDEQDPFNFFWDRNLIYEMMSHNEKDQRMNDVNDFKRVFIGHTPTINWKHKGVMKTKPIYKAQYVAIDTGGCFWQNNGKISLIDITDDDNHILYQA